MGATGQRVREGLGEGGYGGSRGTPTRLSQNDRHNIPIILRYKCWGEETGDGILGVLAGVVPLFGPLELEIGESPDD